MASGFLNMQFPKRLSLNEAIRRLVVDSEARVLPEGFETYAGPLMEVLDALEERFETAIARNPSANNKMQSQIDRVELMRKDANETCTAILDNATELSSGEASLEALYHNSDTPYLKSSLLLLWAEAELRVRIGGIDNIYKNLAETNTALCSREADNVTPNQHKDDENRTPGNWSGVVLELRAANKLRIIAKDCLNRDISIGSTLLVSQKSDGLTKLGLLLIQVAQKKGLPNDQPGRAASGALKTKVSKLRNELKKITGIKAEPFTTFSLTEGWRAHFSVVDKRNAKEEREIQRTTHATFDENRDSPNNEDSQYPFDDEDDPAGQFLGNASQDQSDKLDPTS